MHQSKKQTQWHHVIKSHIVTDGRLGFVHSMLCVASIFNDGTLVHALLYGEETNVCVDAGYWELVIEKYSGTEAN